jgi:deoxyhypusine synthase
MQRTRVVPIQGINFEQASSLEAFTRSLATTGFQASHLGLAIELVNGLIAGRSPIHLSFTGNLISSGLREVVAFLAKHRYVGSIVTTASGIEEDAIKAIGSFTLGSFDADPDSGADYRIGNVLAARSLYGAFENFLQPLLERCHCRRLEGRSAVTPSDLAREMGLALQDQRSFLYWAARNAIPVYCPGITDGAIGDNVVIFERQRPGLCIDVARDHRRIVEQLSEESRRLGALVLGGGISKHYLLNASFFRGGFDAIVRISTAIEYDGSDSGGSAAELISWKKLRHGGTCASVFAEATLAFPLLVAGTFAQDFRKQRGGAGCTRDPSTTETR